MKIEIRQEQHEVLYTDYFFVSAPKLFKNCEVYGDGHDEKNFNLESFDRDWSPYYFGSRRLALAASLWQGPVGIEGELELAVPPAKKSLDTFGYSISEGELDRWDFLRLSALPAGEGKVHFLLSFARMTFFDRPEDVIHKFDFRLVDQERDLVIGALGLRQGWEGLWNIFVQALDAEYADQSLDQLRQRPFRNGA